MPKNAVRRKPTTTNSEDHAGRLNGREKTFPHVSRQGVLRFLVFAAFAVVLAVLISPTVTLPFNLPTEEDYGTAEQRAVARRLIQAEMDFTTIDLAATEQARRNAAGKVPPVYMFDSEGSFRDALQKANTFLALFDKITETPTLDFGQKLALLERDLKTFAEAGGINQEEILGPTAQIWLRSVIAKQEQATAGEQEAAGSEPASEAAEAAAPASESRRADYRFSELSQNAMKLLQDVLEEGVIGKEVALPILEQRGPDAEIQLVKLRKEPNERLAKVADLKRVDTAKAEVLSRARQLYPDQALGSAVGAVASQFVTPTLTMDSEETLKRRQQAADEAEPVKKPVRRNERIIGAGVEWTDQAIQTIEDYKKALSEARGMERRVRASVGHTIILLLLMLGMARALTIIAPQVYSSLRHVAVALLAVTVMVGVAKAFSLLNQSGYLVPVAAAPILLAILMDKRVGLLAGAVLAVLVSMVYGNSWSVLAIVTSGSLAGVLGVVSVRKRSDLVRPGLIVGIVTIAVTVALGFIGDTMRWSAEGLEPVRDAAINGLLVMMLVPGTLSLFESAFRITTDIHLLELTDLNHPILRRMMMEAPGTHHHNLMVGNLAEVAAESIGANSLMARVCSYYHDIGKLNRPEYFSENQTDHNRHDGLSPTMSSRIIARHVKDGVELAREYGLCQPVIDIIEQHHGTDLIRFFYEKALQSDKHDNGVREEDFRYPGPKPQSREAAVVMVADCIESASRSLTNLTPARLHAVADKIISTRFADGQFDNCDLTLKDLHVIAGSIVRLLTSAHHKRVEYPEQESPELVRHSRFLSGG
jgi:putative nucleotidyltransferase with HDIG domain